MKKVIAYIVAIICTFSIMGSGYAAPLFPDVTDAHPNKAEIEFLIQQGIIIADPTIAFGVKQEITRLEAAEMIIRALQLDTEIHTDQVFTDVSPEDPIYPIVATIADAKIMSGNENREFKPYEKLTRGQMAAILTSAFQLEGTSEHVFKDVPKTYWAGEAIQKLLSNKITTGYLDNTYKPQSFISKAHFSVFLARILNPDFKKDIELPKPEPKPEPETKPEQPKPELTCVKPSTKKQYAVNVAVTNVWNQPNKIRPVDLPSVKNPVDMKKWIKAMRMSEKQWLVGRTDTQALYGDKVSILKSSGNWIQIGVNDQYKTGQKTGYQGWVPKSHVTEVNPSYTECSIAVVTANLATLYEEPKVNKAFMEISYTTILPVIKEDGDWLHVQTPADGVKYLLKKNAKVVKNFAAIAKPSQKDIVNSAKSFMGLPYLWAGASGFGFDCSGLMFSVYKNHGIMIPRDSFEQAKQGKAIARKNMQPGDLMFFAYNGGTGKVYHVGMYIGDGKMLHAPNSLRKVEIASIEMHPYKANFSGARRYLK